MAKRTQIRDAVKTLLLGNTSCGQSVYSNRISAFWKSELPSISIFTTDEDASPRDLKNQQYIRTMTLRLEIHAEGNENLDATLDTLSEEVEAILSADQSLMGQAMGSRLLSTSIELAGDSTTPIGVLSLSYEVKYIK